MDALVPHPLRTKEVDKCRAIYVQRRAFYRPPLMPGYYASRKGAPTTAISAAPVISPCFVFKPIRRDRPMRPEVGQRAQRRPLAIGAGAGGRPYRGIVRRLYIFAAMRPLPTRRSTTSSQGRRRRLLDPAAGEPGLAGQ